MPRSSTFQRFFSPAIAQQFQGQMQPALASPEMPGFALPLTGKMVELDMQSASCALQIFPEETGLCPEGGRDDE
jgi:hypothetical protein